MRPAIYTEPVGGGSTLQMIDITRVGIGSQQLLVLDSYGRNRATG